VFLSRYDKTEWLGNILILQKNPEICFTLKIRLLEKKHLSLLLAKNILSMHQIYEPLNSFLLRLNTILELGWYQMFELQRNIVSEFLQASAEQWKRLYLQEINQLL